MSWSAEILTAKTLRKTRYKGAINFPHWIEENPEFRIPEKLRMFTGSCFWLLLLAFKYFKWTAKCYTEATSQLNIACSKKLALKRNFPLKASLEPQEQIYERVEEEKKLQYLKDHGIQSMRPALKSKLHQFWVMWQTSCMQSMSESSGIKPMFPALAHRFFTTEPPGKPHPGHTFPWKISSNAANSSSMSWLFLPCLSEARALNALTETKSWNNKESSQYPLNCWEGKTLQLCLSWNIMDRGVWQATVHGVSRVRDDLVTEPLLTMPICMNVWSETKNAEM